MVGGEHRPKCRNADARGIMVAIVIPVFDFKFFTGGRLQIAGADDSFKPPAP